MNGKDFRQASASPGVEKSAPAIAAQGSERAGAAIAKVGRTVQTISPESNIAIDPSARKFHAS